ncbi:Clp1/GlmU family protein [Sulfurisphaera javensis]|uniref:polynucleotide 5'-hydroxyl-kinase n=1 Tax=Sulfurisphaera javensis TaxID=2049879 RepID=A0AAT9GRP4_9CREN
MFEKDIDIVIKGPCKIKVKQGLIDISGIEINDEIEIKDAKTYTLTTLKETDLNMDCNIVSKFPTLSWQKIGKELGGKILVLGNENSGKSYFSNLVSNLKNIPILDADVGQSSLFIPTFIALSNIKQTLNPREKGYSKLEFFGDKSPTINPSYHIALITKLLQNNIIVDTDGWVSGFFAFKHKLELIYLIDPDYIVIFENEEKLPLPNDLNKKIIHIKRFPLGNWRDRNERKKYRQSLYKEYFTRANEIQIRTEKIFGIPVTNNLFISWGGDLLQISDEEPCEGYYVQDVKGLLLGLTSKGKIVGAGIISNINKDYVTIKTPEKDVDGALMGYISLNENFEERRVKIKKCSS